MAVNLNRYETFLMLMSLANPEVQMYRKHTGAPTLTYYFHSNLSQKSFFDAEVYGISWGTIGGVTPKTGFKALSHAYATTLNWTFSQYANDSNTSNNAGALNPPKLPNINANLITDKGIITYSETSFQGYVSTAKTNTEYNNWLDAIISNKAVLYEPKNWLFNNNFTVKHLPVSPIYLNDFGQMRTPVYYPKNRI